MIKMRKIVIADDDSEIVHALTLRCQQLGICVEQAVDGFEAGFSLFTADQDEQPDLIILDIEMPLDDGLSICEELAREESLRSIPVIIFTGRSDLATVRRCEELGAYYVFKSVNVWKQLEPLICELLDIPEQDPHLTTVLGRSNASTLNPRTNISRFHEV